MPMLIAMYQLKKARDCRVSSETDDGFKLDSAIKANVKISKGNSRNNDNDYLSTGGSVGSYGSKVEDIEDGHAQTRPGCFKRLSNCK